VTVGLISDTHGLLRPDALRRLAGAELIIHAGDVGKVEILAALSAIAPVMAVRGNVDRTQELSFLPETAFAEADSRRIYVLHNIAQIDVDPAAAGFDVIVFGHSHKQELYTKSGVMFVNPGSAGPRRFRLPISIALLNTAAEPMEARFVEIEA
jgi:putative phosphoesterase